MYPTVMTLLPIACLKCQMVKEVRHMCNIPKNVPSKEITLSSLQYPKDSYIDISYIMVQHIITNFPTYIQYAKKRL